MKIKYNIPQIKVINFGKENIVSSSYVLEEKAVTSIENGTLKISGRENETVKIILFKE